MKSLSLISSFFLWLLLLVSWFIYWHFLSWKYSHAGSRNTALSCLRRYLKQKKIITLFLAKPRQDLLNSFQDIWAAYLRKYAYITLLINIEKCAKISETLPMLRIERYYLLFQLTYPLALNPAKGLDQNNWPWDRARSPEIPIMKQDNKHTSTYPEPRH